MTPASWAPDARGAASVAETVFGDAATVGDAPVFPGGEDDGDDEQAVAAPTSVTIAVVARIFAVLRIIRLTSALLIKRQCTTDLPNSGSGAGRTCLNVQLLAHKVTYPVAFTPIRV
ncbi:hypothetical protein ACFQ68_02745 [Amycolatopsis japonica]|uniref:hypothetical protein n=1 Tax=Amycolatopsis japonica TaxID=208439 RepID=UPI0036716316